MMPMLMLAQLSQIAVDTQVGLSAQMQVESQAAFDESRQMEEIRNTPAVAAKYAIKPTMCQAAKFSERGDIAKNRAFLIGR